LEKEKNTWDSLSRSDLVEFGFNEDFEILRASKTFMMTVEWSM
jgi:hypothetical protein